MNKESSHRSHEFKAIGWNQEDITRYEELWEYSQRWGLINLEREDRQFLKKAERLIPKLQNKKASIKKSIEEKSYYLWLNFYLEKIKEFNKLNLKKDKFSVWKILIEEELNLLKIHNPVMGLPDTLKAKELFSVRANLIKISFDKFEAENSQKVFDFDIFKKPSEEVIGKSWKSLIEKDPSQKDLFPILNKNKVEEFRNKVIASIEEFMKVNYPSLKNNL